MSVSSEPAPVAGPSATAALLERWPLPRPKRAAEPAVAGEWRWLWPIFVAGLLLRVLFLEQVPNSVTADELDFASNALQVLTGQGPGLFGLDWTPEPALGLHFMVGSMVLFGQTLFAERLVAAVLTALAIIPFYALTRRVASQRATVLATLLFAAARWRLHFARSGWTNQNHVTDSLANITVRGGDAIFRLASPTSGAEIGTNRFSLRVGEYAEARIKFAGDGQTIYNWPAWWVSGPGWPAAGENDIAEGLGQLTINYHSPLGGLETGTVSGVWARGFHTYGILRGRYFSRVYWDGSLVRTYRTHDDGQPQMLLLTMGAANVIRTGAAGQMVVDYVRAWQHG